MVVVAMDTAMMVVMVTVTRENSGELENPFHVVVELFATAADNDWISASTFHDLVTAKILYSIHLVKLLQDLMWIASIVHQLT